MGEHEHAVIDLPSAAKLTCCDPSDEEQKSHLAAPIRKPINRTSSPAEVPE